LPFELYRDELMPARVIDEGGRTFVVPTRVYSPRAVTTRVPGILEACLREKGLIRRARVGRTALMLLCSEDAISEALAMADSGVFFYRQGDQ